MVYLYLQPLQWAFPGIWQKSHWIWLDQRMMEQAVLVPWWWLGSDTGQSGRFEMLANTDTPREEIRGHVLHEICCWFAQAEAEAAIWVFHRRRLGSHRDKGRVFLCEYFITILVCFNLGCDSNKTLTYGHCVSSVLSNLTHQSNPDYNTCMGCKSRLDSKLGYVYWHF